jgi:hypothetical protein
MVGRLRTIVVRASKLAATLIAHLGGPTSGHAAGATLWGWVIVVLLVLALLAVGLYAFRRMR